MKGTEQNSVRNFINTINTLGAQQEGKTTLDHVYMVLKVLITLFTVQHSATLITVCFTEYLHKQKLKSDKPTVKKWPIKAKLELQCFDCISCPSCCCASCTGLPLSPYCSHQLTSGSALPPNWKNFKRVVRPAACPHSSTCTHPGSGNGSGDP